MLSTKVCPSSRSVSESTMDCYQISIVFVSMTLSSVILSVCLLNFKNTPTKTLSKCTNTQVKDVDGVSYHGQSANHGC